MAKQTFTTGQVLTAAEMTSLQATAMGGGAASTKTANYVLVAADAGTTVAMNAAGATTITVNTSLFAAGDTVFIQNIGAGACTITAGTATVATAGSLILPQNDAGILYFTSTGVSIFYDFIQVGAASPLTTKGDIYTFSTSDTRLGVGANGTILTADSSEATGLKFAAPAGGGITWALLNSGGTSLSGAKTTVSFSAQKQLLIMFEGASSSSASSFMSIRINDDSSAIYNTNGNKVIAQSSFVQDQQMSAIGIAGDTSIRGARMVANASSIMYGAVSIFGADTAGPKVFIVNGGETIEGSTGGEALNTQGTYGGSLAVTSISFNTSAGTWDAGNVFIFGGN